jgi:hypothetical protein
MENCLMVENDTIRNLAGAIAEIFQSGIVIDDDAMHFIDSTCRACSAGQIRAILDDPENTDAEMILRLIFSPDESIQARLEPLVENLKPEQNDLRSLVGQVLTKTRMARVCLPRQNESFCLRVDDVAVVHFVSLLNLSATIGPGIADALNRFKDQAFYLPAKVKLRNARIRFTENQAAWMILFLTSVNCEAGEFLDFFEFAIEFLPHILDETDNYRKLNDLKRTYFNAVKRWEEYEARLFQTNMEIMMARGDRVPYIDRQAPIKKICMIDHLCLNLYGRTDAM